MTAQYPTIALVGPANGYNYGNGLVYYALYQSLCDMWYEPVIILPPKNAAWGAYAAKVWSRCVKRRLFSERAYRICRQIIHKARCFIRKELFDMPLIPENVMDAFFDFRCTSRFCAGLVRVKNTLFQIIITFLGIPLLIY